MYGLIADAIAVFHGFVVVFLLSGMVFQVILKRKLPGWYTFLSGVACLIAIFGYVFLHDCPINPIENYFRELAGEEIINQSFIAHYIQKLFSIELSIFSVNIINLGSGIIVGLYFFNWFTIMLNSRQKQ